MNITKHKTIIGAKLLFLLLAFAAFGQAQTEMPKLSLNQPLERQIKGTETHVFQIKLKKGEFARVEVEPTNIDVIVSLIAPDGKTIVEMDGDSSYLWRESVSAIAETGGAYKLQIKGKGKTENTGSYTVKIAELRKSSAYDRKRIEAERTLIQGIKLNQENKQQESAKIYETSLALWKEVGDKYWEAVTMWNLAWTYFDADRNDEALGLYNQTLLIFQGFKDRIGESAALIGIGAVYRWLKNYESAKDYLEKSLTIRKELKRLKSEFNTLNALIAVYQGLNQSNKSLESLNRMLEISKELKLPNDERDILNRLGFFYSNNKQNEKAIAHFERALEIDRELKNSEREILGLANLGFQYGESLQYEKAQKIFQQALEIAGNTKDKKGESEVLREMGAFYVLTLGNFDKGSEFLLKALNINRELKNDKQDEILILGLLAVASQSLGEYEKFIGYSEKGLAISNETNNKIGQIDFSINLGVGYGIIGQVDKAIGFYEQALSNARGEKLKSKEIFCLFQLATFYEASFQQFEKARELQEQALLIAKDLENNRLTSLSLRNLGRTYSRLKKYAKAQDYYEQALSMVREANDKNGESSNLQSLGLLFATQRQFEEARIYLEQAVKIAKDNNLINQQIYTLSSLGDLYINQSQFEEAIIQLEQAYKLAVETKSTHWQTSLNAAMGSAYSQLNQFEKAQVYHEKSLTIAKESKDYLSEAIALISLGNLYFKLNQYDKARDYFEQVEKIAKDTKNRWLLSFATGGIGSVYTDLSDNKKAQSNYEQSLSLMKEVFDRSGEGNILNSLGNTYLNLKDYDKAQSYYEQSLTIAREVKNKQSEVYPLINLGSVFLNKNQLEKAQSFYEQGLSLAREIKDRGNEGYALNSLGFVYFKYKKYQHAEDFYRQSLAIAKEVQSKKLEGSVLWNLMELFKELRKPQLAIVYGKQAINIFQEIRGNIKGFEKESQQSYLKDKETAYRTLADLLISEQRFYEAQAILDLLKEEEYAQLARTGGKAETVPYAKTEENIIAKIDKLIELRRREDELVKQEKELGEKFSAEKKKELEQIKADITLVNKEFSNALKVLSETDNSVEKKIAEIRDEENLQSALLELRSELKTGAVALYTVIGTEDEKDADGKPLKDKKRSKFGWVILVTPDDRKAYPINVADLEKTVFDFRTALSSEKYDPQPLAERLYNALFRQTSDKQKTTLETDLQNVFSKYQDKTIMWSLDGVLRYIPMAALHDGKQYLVEKYRNVVFTKKSILWLMRQPTKNPRALGLGVSAGNKDLNMSELPGVEKELTDIIKQTDEKTGILSGARKLNNQFKKQEILGLKAEDNKFKIVHIASHYSFNPTDLLSSFLLIGDGKLTFGDMESEGNLFGTVDLLTLSACDTGISGNGTESEGFAFLAQSKGAKSVIASLWKVSDAGTPELMIRFYKLRAENPEMPKGEAFRRAQLSLLSSDAKSVKPPTAKRTAEIVGSNPAAVQLPLFVRDEKKPFAHPHYWASFVLIGNWR